MKEGLLGRYQPETACGLKTWFKRSSILLAVKAIYLYGNKTFVPCGDEKLHHTVY